jgi:AraC-like DNA-binding protein
MSMNKTNNFVNDSNINPNPFTLPRIRVYACDRRKVTDWSKAAPVRPHWRFYWNPEPGAVVSDKHEKYYLDASFILVIPPGVRVKQVIDKPFETLHVHADFDVAIDETIDRLFTIPVSPAIETTIEQLSNAIKQQAWRPFVIGEFIFAILSRLPAMIWRQRIDDVRIEAVCRMLTEHPEHDWSNPELAMKACFSENAFIRRFREVTGLPPQRFVLKLRLEHAAALLLENSMSIDEIAAACGFCDRHYLTKMFKKHFGQPPGRFRAGVNTP